MPLTWPHPELIEGVTDHQREVIAQALSGGSVALLSGGPGVGKTHCTAAIIRAMLKEHDLLQALGGNLSFDDDDDPFSLAGADGPIAVCAPSGKAAVRITEALEGYELGLRARTHHALLEINRTGYDGWGWTFLRNESHPLPYDLIVGDEQGMTDTDLMANTLAACAPGTLVLLVGDPYQLAPVGHGKPFVDMIGAGLPHGQFTELHRFAGRIARVCDAIARGERWEPSPSINYLRKENPENLKHIERQLPADIIEAMAKTIQSLQAQRGVDPIRDVQVICALNETGPLSRKILNPLLQQMLNPLGKAIERVPYRVGDKVSCSRNQWMLGCSRTSLSEKKSDGSAQYHYVANGDIGWVLDISSTQMIAQFGSRRVLISKSHWETIDLAYAQTCHKMQGSQSPVIICLADRTNGADMICSRAWWYTAISRAAKLCVTIGQRSTIDRHCRVTALDNRNTFLQQDIQQWRNLLIGSALSA